MNNRRSSAHHAIVFVEQFGLLSEKSPDHRSTISVQKPVSWQAKE